MGFECLSSVVIKVEVVVAVVVVVVVVVVVAAILHLLYPLGKLILSWPDHEEMYQHIPVPLVAASWQP